MPWELHARVQGWAVAPCCIWAPLSSSMALKGATPVPGPTMIMGVPSGGRRITPGSIQTGTCTICLLSRNRNYIRLLQQGVVGGAPRHTQRSWRMTNM